MSAADEQQAFQNTFSVVNINETAEDPIGMGKSSSGLPFMTDTFPRAIILGPARLLGIISFQPLLELFSRHVDRVVEVSVVLSEAASMAYAASSLNDILIAFDHGDGSSCELPCEEQRPVVSG
jgi:hypothetical protein